MHRADRGFTLVELLVVVAILGVIGAAIAEALFIGLKTVDDTSAQVEASSDAQLILDFFPADVRNANEVSSSTSCKVAGADEKIRFQSGDGNDPTTIVYAVEVNESRWELTRRACRAGMSDQVETLVSQTISPLGLNSVTVTRFEPGPGKTAIKTMTVELVQRDGTHFRYQIAGATQRATQT